MIKNLLRNIRYDWPLHFVLLLTNWLPDNVKFLGLRGALAGLFLGSCGKNFRIGRNVTFYNPSSVYIGDDVYFAYGCWLLAGGEVKIADEVMFGPYVVVSAGNHVRISGSYRFGHPEILPISIGKGSWVGSHVTVLGGASIGAGCMIGSNACVVKGTFPDNCLIVGVPATIKKDLGDTSER